MDSDPLFANVRSAPGYTAIRETGMACQMKFLETRIPSAD